MRSEFIIVGSIGKTYGVNGWVKVHSYTDPLDNILTYQPWTLTLKNKQQSVTLTGYRWHDKTLIVHFDSFDTPEQIQLFVNWRITVRYNQLPSLKQREYYWTDLEGLSVTTVDGNFLGQVSYLFNTGSNDVLVVHGKEKHLIPFLLDQVIKTVDLEKNTIIVDWNI